MIKMLLTSVAILPLLAGVAAARQPLSLNDAQMDQVSAGAKGYVAQPGASPPSYNFNVPPGVIVDFIPCPATSVGCTVVTRAEAFFKPGDGGPPQVLVQPFTVTNYPAGSQFFIVEPPNPPGYRPL